tara:strand:+ start:383 stop:712 length:330 start_codon:yes stop_codon:yes gene_type:complete
MKLTEAKLKQMILDEIKSNLSDADQRRLQADIDLVRKLSMELDLLEKDKVENRYFAQPEEYDKREEVILNRKRRIEAIAQKYGVEFYFGEPGNKYLINLLKNKFRRKSL